MKILSLKFLDNSAIYSLWHQGGFQVLKLVYFLRQVKRLIYRYRYTDIV